MAMDKRTSERMAKLAGQVLRKGEATPHQAKRLAACVLTQVQHARRVRAKRTRK